MAKRHESDASARLAALAQEAAACRRCPLYKDATQTVFGEGNASAALVLVGEQPGNQEDLQGHPFVGPAGGILDRALAEAGLDRGSVYLTNAVKHFKHEARGKRRLHKRPNRYEIEQCRWWLERELAVIKPALVVALGATAAHTLAGCALTLSRERGHILSFQNGLQGIVTLHPSAILRMPDEKSRHAAFESLVKDLQMALELAGNEPSRLAKPQMAKVNV
ncbi:MAG: UdgX family uracil-DNA binding protein [Methylovirgula sp.]|jgi:DNA polymerase